MAGSLLLRRSLRVALLLPAAAAWWAAAVWRVRAVHPGLPLPVAAFTLEAAALLAVTVARVAPGARAARRGGGRARPARARQRWALLLGLALAAFAAASRDPAHRRLASQLRGVGRGLARGRPARAEGRRSGVA